MTFLERISNWISPREVDVSESFLDAKTIEALGDILSVPVRKSGLFEQALSHRSYLRVNKLSSVDSYERLEFLGDGVVDMIVAEYLYKRFPEGDEGFLTKLRARLVNGQTLAKLCKQTGLDELILFGPDIESATIKDNQGIQADIFESVCGALFLQSGFKEVKRFVLKSMEAHVDIQELSVTSDNYKSDLLELLQSQGKEQPVYQVVQESGPPHEKVFEIVVLVEKKSFGKGVGKSKKIAEQQAALETLKLFREQN